MVQFTPLVQVVPRYKEQYVRYTGPDKVFEAILNAGLNAKRGEIRLLKGAIGVCSSVIGMHSMFIAFKSQDLLMQAPYKPGFGLAAGWKYQVQIWPYEDLDWEVEI